MANNSLNEILNKFSSLIKSSSRGSVIGVDIGSSAIKIIQIKKESGRAVLETYGSLSLGPYAGGQVGQVVPISQDQVILALNDLVKESSITTKDSAFCIPASSSLVFLLELPPSINQSDLSGVVETEARKYVPVPITEVSLDWWAIPERLSYDANDDSYVDVRDNKSTEKAPSRVLVAAIHNDTLKKYQDIVSGSNFKSDFFEIEMFSNLRSTIEDRLNTMMIVDIGALKTKVSIVDRGVIQDFHIINKASQDITTALSTGLQITFDQAEDLKKNFGINDNQKFPKSVDIIKSTLDYIFFEINNVLLNYQKKNNKTIEGVILTGGGSMLKGLLDYSEKKIDSSVSMGNPFSKIQSPAFLENVLAESGPEFSVAAGLALRKLE